MRYINRAFVVFLIFKLLMMIVFPTPLQAQPKCDELEKMLMQKFVKLELSDAQHIVQQILQISESQKTAETNILQNIEKLPPFEANSSWGVMKEFIAKNFSKPVFTAKIDESTTSWRRAWFYSIYSIKRIAIFSWQLVWSMNEIVFFSSPFKEQKQLSSAELRDVLSILLKHPPQYLFEKSFQANQSLSIAEKRAISVILNHNWWFVSRITESKRNFPVILRQIPARLQQLYQNRSEVFDIEPSRKTLEAHLKDKIQNMSETLVQLEKLIGTEYPDFLGRDIWKLDEKEFVKLAENAIKTYAFMHDHSQNTFDKLRIRTKQNELNIFLKNLKYVQENPSVVEEIKQIIDSNEPIGIWYRGLYTTRESGRVVSGITEKYTRKYITGYFGIMSTIVVTVLVVSPYIPILDKNINYQIKKAPISEESSSYLKTLEENYSLPGSEIEALKKNYYESIQQESSPEFLRKLKSENPKQYEILKQIIESGLEVSP